jgi:multidrug transporter EmrE-like cation transporter
MFNIIPIALATLMASIDAVALGWLKDYTLGLVSWKFIPIAMIVYSLQPYIFLQSLRYETMTVMNILWDLISDVFVTVSGLLYFKEKLTPIKRLGLGFAFVAIVLFAYDDWSCDPISKGK